MPPFSSKIGRAKTDDIFSMNLTFAPHSVREILNGRANFKILENR